MAKEELQEILSLPIEDAIKELSKSSFPVPDWSDLEVQYDPMKHRIITDYVTYPPKMEQGVDVMKRTPLGLQKLAVRRIAQSMFSEPVERVYTYDMNIEAEQQVVDLIEEVYTRQNNINSENLERAKSVNSSCQAVTIWRVKEEPSVFQELQSRYTLRHKTYTEKDGYKIYAQTDDYGDLLVVSIEYKDKDDNEFFLVYTPELYVRYQKLEDWEEVDRQPLSFLPCVYIAYEEPVWGGKEGTAIVEQLEEMLSYEGMYIHKNSIPTFTIDYGEITGRQINTEEKSNATRRLIKLGKGGKVSDITWKGAGNSVERRYKELRNSFFEQVQMPDLSFSTLINSNTSADNKEFMFTDSRQKAQDLGGEWNRFFYEEMKIIKKFLEVMFPQFAESLKKVQVSSKIRPYSVRTRKEAAEFVSMAGDNMSLETKVRVLNVVDNVMSEVESIEQEKSVATNQDF
jgi:hypothetical protein